LPGGEGTPFLNPEALCDLVAKLGAPAAWRISDEVRWGHRGPRMH